MDAELAFLNQLQALRSPALDALMVTFTKLGNGGLVWCALAVALLLFPKTRKTGLAVALALGIEVLFCNGLLKPLVARARPCEMSPVSLLIARPTDYSFPSGHTGASFAAMSALLFSGNRLWLPALALAAVIAFSRMYLYVHYPTDVLAGALLGIMTGWCGAVLARQSEALLAKIG